MLAKKVDDKPWHSQHVIHYKPSSAHLGRGGGSTDLNIFLGYLRDDKTVHCMPRWLGSSYVNKIDRVEKCVGLTPLTGFKV